MNSHTTQDPYAPFETFEDKGKHKGHPTPEPSAYGAIFVAIVVILVLLRRHARRRDK